MPTSLAQIQEFLDEYDLNYRVDEERDAILIGFGLDPQKTSFRDPGGEPGIQFVIRIQEDGEFVSIFTPRAWNVASCPHKAAVFEAIASIQSRYKMLRFDYDPSDGEIRPNVELPLEDADLTSQQFHRMMHAMLHGVPRFDAVIRQAMDAGRVSFECLTDDEPEGDAPGLARLYEFAEEAGGVEALERLACGDPVEGEEAEPAVASCEVAGRESRRPTVLRRIWGWLCGRRSSQQGDDAVSGGPPRETTRGTGSPGAGRKAG
ncbi:MAG: hypothetical protein ACKO4T_15335 [Planctomycetaceae bacterium]